MAHGSTTTPLYRIDKEFDPSKLKFMVDLHKIYAHGTEYSLEELRAEKWRKKKQEKEEKEKAFRLQQQVAEERENRIRLEKELAERTLRSQLEMAKEREERLKLEREFNEIKEKMSFLLRMYPEKPHSSPHCAFSPHPSTPNHTIPATDSQPEVESTKVMPIIPPGKPNFEIYSDPTELVEKVQPKSSQSAFDDFVSAVQHDRTVGTDAFTIVLGTETEFISATKPTSTPTPSPVKKPVPRVSQPEPNERDLEPNFRSAFEYQGRGRQSCASDS